VDDPTAQISNSSGQDRSRQECYGVNMDGVTAVESDTSDSMTMKEIEDKHGLPCRIRIPYNGQDMFGEPLLRYLTRDVLRHDERRPEWYVQSDPDSPEKGEFVMCYDDLTTRRVHNRFEFIKNL